MKSRTLAVIGAIALIALAVFLRGRFTDDGAGSDGSKRGTDGKAPVVACTPELMEVCEALSAEGSIATEPPELDLDDASAPDAAIDGWITWDPAPQIANFDAGQNAVWDSSEALGSARLAVLLDPATADALRQDCDADTVWTCIASAPGAGLSVGVGEPATAEGVARLLPLAVALSPDLDTENLAANDLRDIVDSAGSQADAAAMSLSATQPGVISIVVGPEDALGRIAGSAQGQNRKLRVAVATPEASATVVFAPRAGRDAEIGAACEDDGVDEALRAAGVDPCSDERDDIDRAGFLYTVRKKAS